MLTRGPAAASQSHFKVFSAALAVPLGLLLLANCETAVYAATPSPEEVADAFDCASALNDKVSKRDVSLNEDLASLSQEGATAAKEEQAGTVVEAALEQDALLHQQLASQTEVQKIQEAKRHQQLMDSTETESNKSVDSLKQEIRNVESEEHKAKEQLAEEEKTLRKLENFNKKLVKKPETAQSNIANGGTADDLRKSPKVYQGGGVSNGAGDVGSTQVDIRHGEEIAEQAKGTVEQCIRERSSFLRDKKFLRHPCTMWENITVAQRDK